MNEATPVPNSAARQQTPEADRLEDMQRALREQMATPASDIELADVADDPAPRFGPGDPDIEKVRRAAPDGAVPESESP